MATVAHPRGSSKFPAPLPLHDSGQVASWAEDLACQFYDLLSAARDATNRKRKRVLSRAAARGKIEEAAEAMEQLLLALRYGLSDAGAGPAVPPTSGGAAPPGAAVNPN